jgi:hypothetical protein
MVAGVLMQHGMLQSAPYPHELADLVKRARFRPGYEVWLEDRDRGQGSRGLTLVVLTAEVDTYHPDAPRPVHHYHIVPAASYNRESWQAWLFERLSDVSRHEDMEWFRLAADDGSEHRPYAPIHAPGWDPYLITVTAPEDAKRTSFRGELNPGTP